MAARLEEAGKPGRPVARSMKETDPLQCRENSSSVTGTPMLSLPRIDQAPVATPSGATETKPVGVADIDKPESATSLLCHDSVNWYPYPVSPEMGPEMERVPSPAQATEQAASAENAAMEVFI